MHLELCRLNGDLALKLIYDCGKKWGCEVQNFENMILEFSEIQERSFLTSMSLAMSLIKWAGEILQSYLQGRTLCNMNKYIMYNILSCVP